MYIPRFYELIRLGYEIVRFNDIIRSDKLTISPNRGIHKYKYKQKGGIFLSKMYTCDEVAQKYQVRVITVWEWIRRKKLNAIKIGKEYRISEEDMLKFENERRTIKN